MKGVINQRTSQIKKPRNVTAVANPYLELRTEQELAGELPFSTPQDPPLPQVHRILIPNFAT